MSPLHGITKYSESVVFYDQKDPKTAQKVDVWLKVFNVTKQDSGLYSCVASSQMGDVQDEVYLDVLSEGKVWS